MKLLQVASIFAAVSAPVYAMIQPPFHPNRSSILETRACRPGFDKYDFCNTKLSVADRAKAVVKLADDDLKPKLLTARGWPQGNIQGVPDIGVPPLDKGQNSLHGVQTLCIDDRCATSFPMPNALGASFNQSMWRAMGDVIGVETRVAYLTGCPEASTWSGRPPAGLDTWSPTINQPRDPRWGRSQEVVSEDPLLLSDYAVAYTKGVQEGEDPRFLRGVATLKHWVAYSLEDSDGYTRHNFCAHVSDYDLGATYFPMFKKAVQDAKAASIMSSYNAVAFMDSENTTCVPTSASAELRHVLRDEWGFQGYQTSDTGAINDIDRNHKYVPTGSQASCAAVKDGQCDIDSGSVYWDNLAQGVANGECAQSDVDLALQHAMEVRVRLGLFDPVEDYPYWNYSTSEFGKNSSQALALDASRQASVLLKNQGGLLPIKKGQRVAVIGPNADSETALVASYLGQLCPGDKWDDLSCLQTVQEAIKAANAGGSTQYEKGCDVNSQDKSGFAAAVGAAKTADVAVLVMGIDQSIEGESHDRKDIELPGVQHDLVQAVLAVQPNTVVVFLNGGVVDISAEKASAPAILESFYPGYHGGRGVADVLFGDHSPAGRLPFTMYHANYTSEVNMTSMCMGCAPGRTYRYFDGPVVYPFGAGLSYTTFKMSWSPQPPAPLRMPAALPSAPATQYTVTVSNTGSVSSSVVVLALWKPKALEAPEMADYPLRLELFGYDKVFVPAGGSKQVTFSVDQGSLRVVHPRTGDVLSAPGEYELVFTTNTMAVPEMAGEGAAAYHVAQAQAQGAVELLRAQVVVEGEASAVLDKFPMPRPGRELVQ